MSNFSAYGNSWLEERWSDGVDRDILGSPLVAWLELQCSLSENRLASLSVSSVGSSRSTTSVCLPWDRATTTFYYR